MPRHLWKKGESGNPAGKPRGLPNRRAEVAGFAEEYGIPLAIRMALGTEPGFRTHPTLRMHMVQYLLDRELGQARKSIDVTATRVDVLSMEHLKALVRFSQEIFAEQKNGIKSASQITLQNGA